MGLLTARRMKAGELRAAASNVHHRGAAELGVDLGEEIVGEVGLAGPVCSKSAFRGAGLRNFEIVRPQDFLDQTRDF
jgi:hypothetical protein